MGIRSRKTYEQLSNRTLCMFHGWQDAIGNHAECEECLMEQKEINERSE